MWRNNINNLIYSPLYIAIIRIETPIPWKNGMLSRNYENNNLIISTPIPNGVDINANFVKLSKIKIIKTRAHEIEREKEVNNPMNKD